GFADMLQKAYGSSVTISSLGVGGSWANSMTNGKVPYVVDFAPDLTVIAYGMNDVNGNFPNTYKGNIQAAITQVRASLPDMEFILVSPCLANPEWNWTPATNFPLYASALSTLVGPGVAMADMTALWTGIMANKRYLDLTGNGINHPNDYGHRNYTAVLFNMLWDTNTMAAAPTNTVTQAAGRNAIRSLTPKLVFSPSTGLSIGLELLPGARAVEIHIYALHGSMVKKMIDPASGLYVNELSAYWDGRGKTGQALPTGNYVLLLYVDGRQVDYRKILLSNP
ncbi:MAG: hypothetical protein JNM63_02415, partial [Spirochaetia bacterium]|nr:hypothetical protein [Spirochaetia bacterium]